jgi:hypothetical protein
VTIHVVTNLPGVQFLFRAALPADAPGSVPTSDVVRAVSDIRPYTAGCLAPCDVELAPGDYFVALSRTGGKTYEHEMSLPLRTATTIEGTYQSRTGTRAAGIVFLSTLVPLGAVLAITGAAATSVCSNLGSSDSCAGNGGSGLIAAGLVTLGLGVVLGTAFLLQHDDATVHVVPQATAQPVGIVLPGARTERPVDSNGLALRFAF